MRILLTRAAGGNEGLAELLRAEGHEPLECPLVRIDPLGDGVLSAEGYDWVVITSRHAVDELLRRLEGALPRVAAIGPGTAAALRSRGIEPALVAETSTQEGVVGELPRPAGRVLFPGAEGSRDVIARALDADFVPLYRTVELEPEALPQADLAVIASASAARALARAGPGIPVVSIGPVTSAEARRLGLDVLGEAEKPDPESLSRAIKLAASPGRSSRS